MKKSDQNKNDLKLWEMFLAGNELAMVQLYRNLFHKLFLFSFAKTKNKENSKDLVQNAFIKLVEQRNNKIYDVEGYLKKSINNNWRTEIRNKKNRSNSLKKYQESKISQAKNHISIDKNTMEKEIDRTLTSTNSKIINLTVEGFKNHEIAKKLGMTEKKVRNRKSESRKKLKKLFR